MAFNFFKNENKTLTVKDPIYGTIIVPYPYSKIVLTKEMQRLGNISQNGFSQYEFKGLENNDRLSHSVGSFYVMNLILNQIEKVLQPFNIEISNDDKEIALCSMLLHDIGHGPFSHSLEVVTNYSHEKRTTDILLGNTEVGNLLVELFGEKKVKQIASFIAEINDQDELGKDSFTKLLNNLVSHQLDADRMDYLARDAYYVNFTTSFDYKKIIDSLSVIVNNNQEYELLILRKGLSSIENVLIQRYQMYRDVYLSPISVLGDELFKKLLERYRENENLHTLPVSKYFKILASDPNISNLNDFVEMSDIDFKKSFEVIRENDIDSIIAYISNSDKLDEYVLIENNVSITEIKEYIKDIFGDVDLSNTLSILNIPTKSKLYKKEQSLNIQSGNRISDITDCTNLIRPQEVLENTYTFFNPEILRMELGLSKEEFKKYEREVKKMIDDLNKKPEEFELKYIINGTEITNLLDKIKNVFFANGFKEISTIEKRNCDEYYDTEDSELYKKGGSLRIRKTSNNDKIKFRGTFKMPNGEGEVYSSRTEIEEQLIDTNFNSFVLKMKENNVPVDFSRINNTPVLNSTTNRTDVLLEKNGVQVCLSLDNSVYTNHLLNDTMATDRMIEIEAVGDLKDRLILNEIHDFIIK